MCCFPRWLAERIADLVGWFSDLPGPVKTILTIFAGLVGTLSLLGGGFLLLAPRIQAATDLMLRWGASHRVAFGAMISAGQLAGLAAGFAAVGAAIWAINEATIESGTGIGEMTEALLALNQGRSLAAIDELIEKRDRLADRNLWADVATSIFNFGSSMLDLRHDAGELSNEIESVDTALAQLVQGGNSDQAAQAVENLGAQLGLSGDELDRWVERNLPGYLDALAQMRTDNELAGDSADEMSAEMKQQADAVEAAEDALKEYADQLKAMTDPVGALRAAKRGRCADSLQRGRNSN